MSSTNTDAAANVAPFLRLPPELRIVIYEHMFPPDEVCFLVTGEDFHKTKGVSGSSGGCVPILATCRVIYAEGKPVLYNNTTFEIVVRHRERSDALGWGRLPVEQSSSFPMINVRNLSLLVAANKSAESRLATWTERFRQTLRAASNIQSLHIVLYVHSHSDFDQDETDYTLRIIGETIRCEGVITARLHPDLGSTNFKPTGYYRMLAGYGGIDKTNETIEDNLRSLEKFQQSVEKFQHSLYQDPHDEAIVLASVLKRIGIMKDQGNLANPESLLQALRLKCKHPRVRAGIEQLRLKERLLITIRKEQQIALNESRETYLREMVSSKEVSD